MPAKKNLIGQTFGKLTVIEETPLRKNKSIVWKCKCKCGNEVLYSTKELRSDGIIQCPYCGYDREPKTHITETIIGKKFNHLTVINKTNKTKSGKILYACKCDCGNNEFCYITRTDLITGHTQSCGCIKRKFQIGQIINNRQIIDILGTKNKQCYYKCKCLFCGREYEVNTTTLQKTISCGCQKSIGEYNIIQILKNNNIPYRKEYVFPNSNYRYDFAIFDKNDNVIRLIEFDGEQHYEQNIKKSGWNTYEKYQYTLNNDKAKNELAKLNNIPLIRIPYWERDNITLELLMDNKYLIL